jgi:hypothetical protein
VSHAFETFSDNFKTWVIFFGPKGGYGGQGITMPYVRAAAVIVFLSLATAFAQGTATTLTLPRRCSRTT